MLKDVAKGDGPILSLFRLPSQDCYSLTAVKLMLLSLNIDFFLLFSTFLVSTLISTERLGIGAILEWLKFVIYVP